MAARPADNYLEYIIRLVEQALQSCQFGIKTYLTALTISTYCAG